MSAPAAVALRLPSTNDATLAGIAERAFPERTKEAVSSNIKGMSDALLTEIWRPVEEYEGSYSVSDRGRVWSNRRTVFTPTGAPVTIGNHVLLPWFVTGGYLTVALSRSGAVRKRTVHLLVLEAFVGQRPPGLEACHGDGDPANNQVRNLRWDTHRANMLERVDPGAALRVYPLSRTCIICGVRYSPDGKHRGRSLVCSAACLSDCRRVRRQQAADEGSAKGIKLNAETVGRIRRQLSEGVSGKSLAAEHDVSRATISMIKTGKLWVR